MMDVLLGDTLACKIHCSVHVMNLTGRGAAHRMSAIGRVTDLLPSSWAEWCMPALPVRYAMHMQRV